MPPGRSGVAASRYTAAMEAAGHAPDARFFELQIAAAESAGLFDDADRLYRRALELGLGAARPPPTAARLRQTLS